MSLLNLALGAVKVDAGYQIRPNYDALVSVKANDFFTNIRKMETTNGPMGLNMPDNTDNINKGYANGIDVHMIKNSEWGAVALLSLSGYGAGSNDGAASWSNGNNTGVYGLGNGNWEYTYTTVTGASSGNKLDTSKVSAKYYDTYTPSSSYTDLDGFVSNNTTKIGHAVSETRTIFSRN